MNTHDKYELPPLPYWSRYDDLGGRVPSEIREGFQEYARAAIEDDRKRRMPPNEPFVIVIDRMYDGEGPSLAYWNGENYQFTDGDCYDREGDTLDGYSAEFLTDHQLEKRLFSDRQRRGEPVGEWVKAEYGNYPALVWSHGYVAQIGAKLYANADSTLPYEQALSALIDKIIPGLDSGDILADAQTASAALTAEPEKVTNDAQPLLDMIDTLCNGLEWNIENHPEAMNESDAEALAEARALLASYTNQENSNG